MISTLVPDHIFLWGLLIKLRREFEQEINIRPAKIFKGVQPKLANPVVGFSVKKTKLRFKIIFFHVKVQNV